MTFLSKSIESFGLNYKSQNRKELGRTESMKRPIFGKVLWPYLLFLTLPLYIADQATKWWTVLNLEAPFIEVGDELFFNKVDGFPVIEGFFNWVRIHNTGVAWGFGNGSNWAPFVFTGVLVVALVGITVMWKRGFFGEGVSRFSPALILCGAAGNLTDRLFQGFQLPYMQGESFWDCLRAGYVVDFLDFTIPLVDYRYPAFNVADSCICVGACLMILSMVIEGRQEKSAAK